MAEITVRIYYREADGKLVDGEQDFDLSSFAGFLPSIGDSIIEPGVPQGLNRHDASNRVIWTVVGRVFNPRDLENYVAIIVEERRPNEKEHGVVTG
jgi:hypothetical protein